jgi:hypothetical protein
VESLAQQILAAVAVEEVDLVDPIMALAVLESLLLHTNPTHKLQLVAQ